MTAEGEARVRELVRAARRLADPRDAIGAEARRTLPTSTGLSPEGVALAIERCLETNPSDSEIRSLCASVEPAPRARVLLSSTVFTGIHRAVALALAGSDTVVVRPSRRQPETARLLCAAAGDLFECADELSLRGGDHLWAYGADETLADVRRSCPRDVKLHAHGDGMGIAIIDLDEKGGHIEGLARALTEDIVLFDQRGCLSPRVALVRGAQSSIVAFAHELGERLAEAERRIPLGAQSADERAAVLRYRETMRFAGHVLQAGSGYIGIDERSSPIVVPPAGRNLHVVRFTTLEPLLAPVLRWVTAVGVAAGETLRSAVREMMPWARFSALGEMQRPPFDGPVDRRSFHFAAPEVGFG